MSKKRKVVRSRWFEKSFAKILVKEPRAAEALKGLEEIILRQPELGMAIRDCDPESFASWVLHLDQGSIRVIYSFDSLEVVLLGAMIVPSQ